MAHQAPTISGSARRAYDRYRANTSGQPRTFDIGQVQAKASDRQSGNLVTLSTAQNKIRLEHELNQIRKTADKGKEYSVSMWKKNETYSVAAKVNSNLSAFSPRDLKQSPLGGQMILNFK